MARRRDDLLGRHREMALLTEALGDAVGGRSRFVIVAGDAGIGKSRLLEELTGAARDAGCLSLTGRAAEFESDVPFAVLADALDTYLRTLDERDLDRLWVDRLGALAAVFPALARLSPAVDVPVNAGERFRVHRAVGELVERLAARQPVLLVLDDLQWADPASLELAAHLTRRPPEGAVMVAFGVRSGAMPVNAGRSLAAIEMADHVLRIDVPPLPVDAVAELVGADPDTARRLHELTRGNPFFALQLARSGGRIGSGLDQADVPAEVQRAIRVELEALPEIAQEVAAAAAVAGDPFDLDLAIAATERDEDEALDGLDHLCVQGVVRTTDSPRTFQFVHPLVRSAIYQAMPPGTRIARHRRIAEHLSRRGAGPIELAPHVEHSARHGDMGAIDVLGHAAESVIAQAPVSAARWLTTALSLLPASEPPERRIRLLGHLAQAHGAVGDIPSGLAALRHSMSIVPDGNHRARTSVAIARSEGERLLGQPDVAAATLGDAYGRLDDRESSEAARLAVAQSTNALYLGAYDEMLRWADEAERVAALLGDGALLGAALAARTAGAAFSGQTSLALQLHDRAVPMIDGLDDATLAFQLDALGGLAGAEVYLDLYAHGYAHSVRGLAIARRTGQTHLMPLLTPLAGVSAMMVGDFAAAAEILDDAVESTRMVSNESVLAWLLLNRALLALMTGDLDTSSASSSESWTLAEPLGEGLIRGWSAAIRADYLREAGRPDEALAMLLSGAGGPDVSLIGGGWRGLYLELQVQCHLDLGDTDAARGATQRARALADDVPLHIAAMAADRAEALLALESGDSADAVTAAQAALEHAEAIGAPIHVAICQTMIGRALARGGDLRGAVEALHAASDGYDTLGSIRYRDQVDAELRRLGHTVHRRTRSGDRTGTGLGSLTGRELEVVELIGRGATNRQIAGELFLSMKTVETHVRNIFNKLGVGSRAEITRVVSTAAEV